MPPPPTQYDVVRYPSYTHPQTHPDRLAVIGRLLGLEPAPVNHSRVLELGCGDASNLVPMACGLPGSKFVGLDLAAQPIQDGWEMIRDLGLDNIRLVQGDVTAVNQEWGEFDYIIAHGLFSWVPAPVREQILEVCRQRLAPQGIAFISYNAFPGAHLRQMLSEMLLFHVRGFDSAAERIGQALALARFLAQGQNSPDLYRQWMGAELETLLDHQEGHLYHDELAPVNQPFYFTQFIEQAAAHQLQYLAEADFFEMFDHSLSDGARETLAGLGRNRILREQYLDFLKCRRFRQTLLCHRQREPRLEPDAEKITGLLVSSMAQCTAGELDLRPGVRLVYQTPKSAHCETDSPLGKAALAVLGRLWPAPLPFDQLFEEAVALLRNAGLTHEAEQRGQERLPGFLAKLYSAGVIELRSTMPAVATGISQRPVASPLARWQAQRGRMLTTAFHLSVQVEDEVGRNVILWLDGTLDRHQLLEKLWHWLKAKDALTLPDGDQAAARNRIAADLEQNLAKLARLGLLVG
jgi:methyltransferase-like protein/2-polyprenyl-3-methyl-5-hydroxy-6-metoxy-1,4-benzoquinol methylase